MIIVLAATMTAAGAAPAPADALSALDILRVGGCGGTQPASPALRRNVKLDQAAEQWAAGRTLESATQASGYDAQSTRALHVSGTEAALVPALQRAGCRSITDPALRDVGLYRRGTDTWLLLASAYEVSAAAGNPLQARRVLELVNEVRARGARCGGRAFGPVPPVRLSPTLAGAAQGHAADMAMHDYFEHQDLAGHSPADRVRATGYREKLVGENIAYGPRSAEEVVRGWLDSPGHCENIMDPRFAEMGIANAPGRVSRHGLYWVQVLAAPASG